MFRIEIIAVGKLREPAFASLWQEYTKRLQWPLTLTEIDSRKPNEILSRIEARLDQNPRAFCFTLDERGKSLSSQAFAGKLQELADAGQAELRFLIGGADGLGDAIRRRPNSFLLSFGAQTWPHQLARVMLAEQVYRAQQILLGHPYHRE
jgi:23S rRNA (pseudouridine1915-N3)-methyltransferase